METESMMRHIWRPLTSRKVRVALATVIAAFAAEAGLNVSDELVLTILGVGAALILGIAHEDAGRLAAGAADTGLTPPQPEECQTDDTLNPSSGRHDPNIAPGGNDR